MRKIEMRGLIRSVLKPQEFRRMVQNLVWRPIWYQFRVKLCGWAWSSMGRLWDGEGKQVVRRDLLDLLLEHRMHAKHREGRKASDSRRPAVRCAGAPRVCLGAQRRQPASISCAWQRRQLASIWCDRYQRCASFAWTQATELLIPLQQST